MSQYRRQPLSQDCPNPRPVPVGAPVTTAVKLSNDTVGLLGENVMVPAYDRAAVTPGIAHIGVGGFHRAHQAVYLDDLMNVGEAMDWGIVGIGLLPQDAPMAEALGKQDCLYTVVTKGQDGSVQARVVGSMVAYHHAPADRQKVVAVLADPAIRIVTLTITEGGYNIDQLTGGFLGDNLDVQAEVAGAPSRTVFGFLYDALTVRKLLGVPPFVVASCDNIPGNGAVARAALIGYATLRDPAMAEWIGASVRFPSSMVDRITPKTTAADREHLARVFGVEDAWPVVCERFKQWALEDNFPYGRPPLEAAGVQLAADVEPFERMKLRLLNASHQGLAYFASLLGIGYVDEAASDPLLARFVRAYMDIEATPTLRPVPGVDLSAYKDELLSRFANRQIRDTVARLAEQTSDRIPQFLLPVVRDRLAVGGPVGLSAAIVASWARYAEGLDESGKAIEIVDQAEADVRKAAAASLADPLAFLRQADYFGDLAETPQFAELYRQALASLRTRRVRATLADLLEEVGA
ncbi:mannitol dehydrogenase family protein [Brooklawnia cerclae]